MAKITEVTATKGEVLKERIKHLSTIQPYLIKNGIYMVSAIYTVLLFISQSHTPLGIASNVVFGVVLELSKLGTMTTAVVGTFMRNRVHWAIRIVCFLVSLGCFYFSIRATEGFQLIELDQANKSAYYQSEEYKTTQKKISDIDEAIKVKQTSLTTAQTQLTTAQNLDATKLTTDTDKEKTLTKELTEIDRKITAKQADLMIAIQKNHQQTKKQLELEIANLQKDKTNNVTARNALGTGTSANTQAIQNTIDTLTKSIEELNAQKSNLNGTATTTTTATTTVEAPKDVKGYARVFGSQEALNQQLGWLAILLEVIGIVYAVLLGLSEKSKKLVAKTTLYYSEDGESISPAPAPAPQQPTTNNTTLSPVIAKKPNKIGFQQETQEKTEVREANETEIDQYLDYIFENEVGGISPGYKKTCTELGISFDKGRKIKSYLEMCGIIEVQGAKTVILVNKNDVPDLLS